MSSRATGLRRYLATNSSQGDFSTLTPPLANGIFRNFGVSAGRFVSSVSANWIIEPLIEHRGARFVFFGTNAQNLTFNYRLWVAEMVLPRTADELRPQLEDAEAIKLSSWGSGTVTLGTLEPASDNLPSGNLIADTLTFTLSTDATTPKGIGTARGLAYQLGDPQVYSPADNTVAELIVPDFGSGIAGVLVEFDLTGATGANCLIEKTA